MHWPWIPPQSAHPQRDADLSGWGSVYHSKSHVQHHQQNSSPPAQRDHTGGRPQHKRFVSLKTPSNPSLRCILCTKWAINSGCISSVEDLKTQLHVYISAVNEKHPGLVKTVTHSEQKGLSQARISGWKAATGDVVAILDAHIEVHVKWCETAQLTSVFHNKLNICSII